MSAYKIVIAAVVVALTWCLCLADSTSKQSAPAPIKPTLAEAVQPDYSKWRSIKSGMTEADVRHILGKPLAESELETPIGNVHVTVLTYGRLRFDTPALPHSYDFFVSIAKGKVEFKQDPFGERLGNDGKPTSPSLILPEHNCKFGHIPRFVDFRWNPCSGTFPIEYTIEVDYGYRQVDKDGEEPSLHWERSDTLRTDCPYVAYSFKGKGLGRWRVKATNALAESPWSEWRQFSFGR